MEGAFYTKKYRNVFAECGYTQEEIDQKIKDAFHTVFYEEGERFYFEAGDDMGYFEDTGNFDARTEGMSYAMMMSVQMNMKNEFDRVWKWVRTYMYMDESFYNHGYFAWSCGTDGNKNADGPAPDGEEFFAMALFFASHRWGDGEGIFNYSDQAREILHCCLHNGEDKPGDTMWELSSKLIKFVPNCDWSDPSYHLPHFYELFALWADEEDRPFWKEAAKASRAYLKKACHPVTGMCAEYATYEGEPYSADAKIFGDTHNHFYSDSYRTVANIGLDYEWFAPDEWNCENNDRMQKFFSEQVPDDKFKVYEIDGTVIDEPALHPVAIIATTAMASLAAKGPYAKQWVEKFWNTPLRKGERRYYDNCLYLFSLLALSGNYRIW